MSTVFNYKTPAEHKLSNKWLAFAVFPKPKKVFATSFWSSFTFTSPAMAEVRRHLASLNYLTRQVSHPGIPQPHQDWHYFFGNEGSLYLKRILWPVYQSRNYSCISSKWHKFAISHRLTIGIRLQSHYVILKCEARILWNV